MLELAAMLVAPAIGGALLYYLWTTRAPRPLHTALAVGQVPVACRRRRAMAIRREAAHV